MSAVDLTPEVQTTVDFAQVREHTLDMLLWIRDEYGDDAMIAKAIEWRDQAAEIVETLTGLRVVSVRAQSTELHEADGEALIGRG